ncbi:MAG: T9SS type A sorting domain-containing protein [Bacteroidia bacterium]
MRFNYRQSTAGGLKLRTDISNWTSTCGTVSHNSAQNQTTYACTGNPQGNFVTFNGESWSCSDADGFSTVQQNANLTVSLAGLGASYSSSDPQVTLTGTPAGGTFSGPGVSGNFFNPSAAGTGPVVVTYSYTWPGTSCTRVASFTTNVTGACTVEAFATGTNATCQGANNGTASASATGSSPFTYSWAPGGETTENISGLAPGTYTVTVTATGGCTATASYTVLDGPAPTYNSTSVSACVSYIWSVNSQTYTASGSYTAQVGPCAYEVLDLTVTPQPPAPTGLACYETASFNNTTCSWDVTGTQPAMPTLACYETASFNNTTCSWDVTGTQPAMPTLACYETASFNNTTCSWDVTGTQPAMPTLACYETASFNNTTCSWDVTGTQPAMPTLACYETASFNTTTCSWDVTGTQPAMPTLACYETATFNNTTCSWDVTGTPLSASCVASDAVCFGGLGSITVSASGGTAPYSGTGTFNLVAGTYNYTVTDNGGCTSSCSATIAEPAKVEASSITSTPSNCGGSTGTATVVATGGDGNYSYLWAPAGGTSASATGLASGSYTVTITDGNGCTGSATVVVGGAGSGPDPAGAIAGPAGACRSTTVTYSIAPVSGASSYIWSLPVGASGSSTGTSITVTFSSTYGGGFICVTPTNACGNGTPACINVPVLTVKPTTPGLISGPNPVCGPTTATYSVAPVSGATNYVWSVTGTGVSIVSGNGTNSVQVSIPAGFGQGSISVYAQNCKGNSPTRNQTLTGVPTHSSALFGPIYNCPNTSASFSISVVPGTATYTWSITGDASIGSSSANSCTVNFGPAWTSGVLTVTTSSTCGSFSRSYTLRSVPTQPGGITGQASALCNATGVSYSIAAVAGATGYNWTVPAGATITSGQGTTSIMVNFGTSAGNVCVTASNSCGSSVARCLAVITVPAAPAAISGPASVCKSQTGTYSISPVSGATSYVWSVTGGASIVPSGTSATVNYNSALSTSATVRVNAVNACGLSQPRTLAVAVNLGCRTSGEEMTAASALTAYPNPTNGLVTINFNAVAAERYTVKVVDLLGNVVVSDQLNAVEGNNMKELNLTNVAKGMYLMSLETEGGNVQTLRLIVE